MRVIIILGLLISLVYSKINASDVMQYKDYKVYTSLESEYTTNDSLITVLNDNIVCLKEFETNDILNNIINDIQNKIMSLESRNNFLNIQMINLYNSSKQTCINLKGGENG